MKQEKHSIMNETRKHVNQVQNYKNDVKTDSIKWPILPLWQAFI